jgi:hypothetical protein
VLKTLYIFILKTKSFETLKDSGVKVNEFVVWWLLIGSRSSFYVGYVHENQD